MYMFVIQKGNAEECSNYHTVTLILHASKVMLKILQDRLQQYVKQELPDENLSLEKAEASEIKLSFVGSQRKQGRSRKTYTSASLTKLKPLIVWITTNCGKFLKRWYRLAYLPPKKPVCNSRNNRTTLGTVDWFKIGKGLCLACIVSSCLFNLYAEYIIWNAGLDNTSYEMLDWISHRLE